MMILNHGTSDFSMSPAKKLHRAGQQGASPNPNPNFKDGLHASLPASPYKYAAPDRDRFQIGAPPGKDDGRRVSGLEIIKLNQTMATEAAKGQTVKSGRSRRSRQMSAPGTRGLSTKNPKRRL